MKDRFCAGIHANGNLCGGDSNTGGHRPYLVSSFHVEIRFPFNELQCQLANYLYSFVVQAISLHAARAWLKNQAILSQEKWQPNTVLVIPTIQWMPNLSTLYINSTNLPQYDIIIWSADFAKNVGSEWCWIGGASCLVSFLWLVSVAGYSSMLGTMAVWESDTTLTNLYRWAPRAASPSPLNSRSRPTSRLPA